VKKEIGFGLWELVKGYCGAGIQNFLKMLSTTCLALNDILIFDPNPHFCVRKTERSGAGQVFAHS
jgi:hypothetical protein